MKLTDKQIADIHKLDTNTVIEIIHECAERLGVVSVDEYCQITGEKKRTAYQKIKDGKIKSLTISGKIFPVINT